MNMLEMGNVEMNYQGYDGINLVIYPRNKWLIICYNPTNCRYITCKLYVVIGLINHLGQLFSDLTVLPNPGTMVFLWKSSPINGHKIQVSELL